MSDLIPVPKPEDDEERKQGEMDFLSGKHGLDYFCNQLREEGITLPPRDVWKYAKRKHVETAMHATFSALGGVPGMIFWAGRNPDAFYTAYMKLAPAESMLGTMGGVQIFTNVPDSPLNTIEIDEQGFIKRTSDDIDEF